MDADFLALCINCLYIPLRNLLDNGFSTGHGYLRSPTSINAASSLTCIAIQSSQNDFFGGQAIPLLDYDLAPYVGMSYVRNLFTAIGDYLWDHDDIDLDKFTEDYKKLCKSSIDPYLKKHRTIMDDEGHTFLTESIIKFLLDQDITLSLSKVYKLEDLARRKTEMQTFQAMEAMVHNLNTMQCFPGYERLWVFDKFSDQWCLFSFKELYQRFKQGRYYALSFNVETKQTEVQLIEDCVVRPNEKDIYTTCDSTGGVYTTTLDHRFLTGTCNTDTSGSVNITGYEPAMSLQQSVLPLSFKIPELKETKGMFFNSEEVSISMLNQQELTKYQNKNLHCEDILFSFNSDLAAFLGYYIAVGIPQIDSSSFDGPTIRFGISTHNDCDFTHHVEVLKTLIKNLGIVNDDSAFFVNADIGDLFVTFNKPLIFFVLDRICGKGMSNYHIPNFILSGTKELQNVFLEAMKLRVSNDGIFHSYSADLIADLRLLFLSRGVIARKVKTDIASDYSLEWPNLKSLDTNNSTFTLSVIDETSPAPEEDEVYDISVAKNQNFVLADGAIVHNSRAGSQTPFSSVNFGTDTSWEGRLVSKCTMQAFDKGLGKGETAIFPIAIFRMKKGITDKGSPNYDLFKMSCEVSAKRLFPNWVNVDAPYNLKYYKPEDPRTQIAAMGCADGNEMVIWKYGDKVQMTSFTTLWDFVRQYLKVNQYNAISEYIDTEKTPLQIYDSHSPDKFVQVKKVIRNKYSDNWRRVLLNNGRVLELTGDHPLPVIQPDGSTKRTPVDQLTLGSSVPLTDLCSFYDINGNYCQLDRTGLAWLYGLIITDGMYTSSYIVISIGLDEYDIYQKILMTAPLLNSNAKVICKEQHRGQKGNYLDVVITVGTECVNKLIKMFNGVQKIYRNLPSDILNESDDYRAAFLAGMIDGDGYINSRRINGRVQIGSTNKTLALGQATLAQSLKAQAKIYLNHFTSLDSMRFRYRVEFFVPAEIIPYLASNKKKNHIGSLHGKPENTSTASVKMISVFNSDRPSFDVETASDRFDLSGINVHNCRTRVISNVYDPKHEICYGRGNLFWTTLNLPYIALEVKESLEKVSYPDGYSKQWLIDAFFKRLDQEIDDILDFSRDRLRIISKRKAFNYPFAMGQHEYVDSEKLNINDSIEEVIKQGTISVGFIGLAETLITLIGKHHGESEEAQELGLKIVSFMRARMDQESKNTNMNYSLMATPAEGCTGRLCKLIAKRFGIIPGITDKKYLVNSSHVPPKFHISVADKIRIEAPYHELENAGHIFYCEQDADISKNPEALEDIVTMAADAGCGYIAVNHPVTRDPVCGYVGPLNPDGTCPRCGRKEYEGVTARKLLNLTAYSPDPEYAVTSEKLEDEDKTINDL